MHFFTAVRSMLICGLLATALPSLAQSDVTARALPQHPEVRQASPQQIDARPCAGGTALVLGGGGARGVAHIGVLQELQKLHVPVKCVVGTSMGAIVGGLFAAGYSPLQIDAMLHSVDWQQVFSDDPGRALMGMRAKNDQLDRIGSIELGVGRNGVKLPRGALEGQNLQQLLSRWLLPVWRVRDFNALSLPFRAVATDIGTGRRVVLARGSLPLAIRASMSVPAVFAPVSLDGKLLVDGGISDNVPINVARALGAKRLIVVDVSAPLRPASKLNSPLAITDQMITVMMQRETQRQLDTLGPDDVLIRPRLGDLGSADFAQAYRAVAQGRAAAAAEAPALERLAVGPTAWLAWEDAHRLPDAPAPVIDYVNVRGAHSRTAPLVADHMSGVVGTVFNVSRVDSEVDRSYGDGTYERIDYELLHSNGVTGLQVTPVDKSWGPDFLRVGLNLSDDFRGNSGYQAMAEYDLTGLDSLGREWRNRISLGQVAGFQSEVYQPFGPAAQFFTRLYGGYRAINQPVVSGDTTLAQYRVGRLGVGAEVGWNPDADWSLYTGLQRGRDSFSLSIGDPAVYPSFRTPFADVYVGMVHDDLDDADFPTRGWRGAMTYTAYRRTLGGEANSDVARVNYDQVLWHDGRDTLLAGLRGQSQWGNGEVLQSIGVLGGFLDLSGLTERSLVGNQLAFGRLVGYRDLNASSERIVGLPFYLGGSLEAGNVWNTRSAVNFDRLIYAGSAFIALKSPFGPIFFGIGHASGGRTSFYLSFGSMIRSSMTLHQEP